jgi:plastocyanin
VPGRRTLAALATVATAVTGLAAAAPIVAHTGGNPTIGFRAATYTPDSVRILPGQTVTWSPDAGTDFDHHPLVFDNHPEIAGATTGTTPFPYTFATAGRYTYFCRIHGPIGMRGEVLVTVNDPPVASFSAPLSAEQGSAVTLDASSSMDPNGQALTYAWDFDGDGTFEETSTSATVVHAFPAPGSFTVGLRVTDSNDDAVGPESSTAVQTITIVPRASGPGGGDSGGGGPAYVAPVVKISPPRRLARRTVLRRGVAVRASASKAGLAAATLRRGRLTVGRGSAGFVAAGTRTLTIRLTAAGRRSLRRGRPKSLRLTVVLTDAAGNDSRATVAVPLR